MNYLIILVSIVCVVSSSYAKEPSKVVPVSPYNTLDCGQRSLLYRVAALIRDDETPRKKAVQEFKKQSRVSDTPVSEDIVRIVYDDLSTRTPNWIEGYVYGLCVLASNVDVVKPPQSEQPKRQM